MSKDFNSMKPWGMLARCVVNPDHSVAYFLHPENSNLKADGTPVDWVEVEELGQNVMVQIPKFYYVKKWVEEQQAFIFGVTDKPVDTDFVNIDEWKVHPAFFRDRTKFCDDQDANPIEVDYRYVGAFHGWVDGKGRLRSLPNKIPTVSINIGTFRTHAKNMGVGWSQFDYYLLYAIQMLYITEYGHPDSQTMIGRGFVDGNNKAIPTGGTLDTYNSYNVDSGTKFITYAATVMRNEILMYSRKIERNKNIVFLDEPITKDNDGNELTHYDILESENYRPEEIFSKKEELHILEKLLASLGEREKAIIDSLYFRNKTQKEVALELGISQSYIARLEKQILKKLRNNFDRINVYSKEDGGDSVETRKLSDEKIGELCYLFGLKLDNKLIMSLKDMAEKLNISQTSVRNYFSKYKSGELRNYKVVPVKLDKKYLIEQEEKVALDETRNLLANVQTDDTKTTIVKKHTININGTKMFAEDIINILQSITSSLDKNREYNLYLEIK